jgi:hypothetical protein
LKKGHFYTVRFNAGADRARKLAVAVSQAHDPWQSLGLGVSSNLDTTAKDFQFGFVALSDDEHARLSFSLGDSLNDLARIVQVVSWSRSHPVLSASALRVALG